MLRLIHSYKQSIGIVFLFIAACFALSGVGVNVLHSGDKNNNPIKVGDRQFSYAEVQTAQKRLEMQYRRMFGDKYAELARSLNLRLEQQAIDSLIDGYVIEQAALKSGFRADNEQVQAFILNKLFSKEQFPNGFDANAYSAFLQNTGQTNQEFEEQIRSDLIKDNFINMVRDSAWVSKKEALKALTREETEYTIATASASPADFIKDAPEPSDENIKKYYEANAVDYENPARVSYDYVVFDPKDFKAQVNVSAQDVEFYYSENSAKFSNPEQVKLRMIKFIAPKNADAKARDDLKAKAQKAYEAAISGKPFESLVTEFSDDIPAKATGGSLGWVSRADLKDDSIADAAFKLQSGGVTEPIQTNYGYIVAKVEEYKASTVKPLDEVRASIENQIREEESPAYAAAKAKELASGKDSASFSEHVKALKLTVVSTDGLLDESKDPEPALKGLTRHLLESGNTVPDSVATFDSGDKTVVIKVVQFKPSETAPLDQVRAKVVTALKGQAAKKLARESIDNALAELKNNGGADFEKVAAKYKFKASKPEVLTENRANLSQLSPEMKDAIFATNKDGTVLPRTFSQGENLSIGIVTRIKAPEIKADDSKLTEAIKSQGQAVANEMIESVVARLKAGTNINVDQSLVAG